MLVSVHRLKVHDSMKITSVKNQQIKARSRIMIFSAILFAIFSSPAQADALSSGDKAYKKGDLRKAVEKWSQSSKPEAAHRIAILAEEGKMQGCDAIYCAASWYFKAATGGHIPSITHLAILNFNNGHKEVGVSQLQLAARWNDSLARDLLGQMDKAVPEPDLYNQALQQERARQLAAEIARQQQQTQVAQMLGYFIGCGLGGGCALPSGNMVATQPAPPAAPLVGPMSGTRFSSPNVIHVPPPPQMCPDGTYVIGTCRMAPNGRFVGGQPQMAPDGSFVGGTPRMTPNGRFVGGNGPITMCPDGSFVAGSCRLAPNGEYVGQ